MTEKSRIKNSNFAKASLGKQESKRETFAGFVEEFDVARKRKFLKFEYRISRLEINFARRGLAKLLGTYDRLASKIFQPFTKYKILNTKYKQRFVGLTGIIIIIFGSIFLQVMTQTKPVPKLQLTDLPYQEKVADGVWTLKNREPIQQVLASAKQNTDLNLKENKQISNAKYPISNKNEDAESDIGIDYDILKYRWNVTISSGTKFEFGGIDSNTPDGKVKPEVKITNKEGWFVAYTPREIADSQSLIANDENINNYVVPEVKGNVISWKLPSGVVARYTMMQDRVKADYIINDKSNLPAGKAGLESNKLEFNVYSGQEDPKSSIINPKSLLKGELMPGGDIEWYSELVDSGGQTASQFTFPAPIVKEAGIKNHESRIGSEYEFNKINDGQYFLAIVLDPNQVASATWPLTIDPVVIDGAATATGTAYGNGRKILRDAWGNLIALIDGGTGDDNVYTKDYNSTTWTDEAIDIDGGAGSSVEIAADLDSSNNIHVVYRDTTLADIVYVKITVTRAADNTITSVAKGTLVSLDITGTQVVRPSLIVANKGGGVGVEKVAVAYAMSGVSTRTEARFMQRDVAKENYKDTILATSGLSGYWRLGESSGTNANDESTTANDGTYQASPTLGVAGAIDEDPDTAATFLASSLQYVSVPDNNAYDFGTGNFSLEVWVNRELVPSASEFILGHSGGNGATDWELYWRPSTNGFQSRLGATSCNSGTGADITDSKWHHVVVTMDRAGLCTWYIDGQVSGTPTNISGQSALNLTNTSILYIGRRNSGLYYNGSLDEVAIYKGVVLTADQVEQHYDAGTYAWKNASEEISGVGTCSDTATSGAAGIPNAATCKGAADRMLNVATATSIHPVLAQIPGKPKRSPASVKKDINGTFTTLTNTIDNNTGTTDDVNSLTTTDYIYVGDDKPFSKVTFDITNTNSSAATFATTTVEYCSAQSGGTCTTWTDLSNFIDNSATATIALSEDGSILFDESADWVTATVDSVASKYWIRLRPSAAMDSTVSIAEVYITDRNSKALAVVGGVDSTDDLGASYVPWDEIGNAGWENNPASVGVPWRSGITALDTLGGNWTGYTNFPLSAAVDYKNNAVYVGYVEDTTTDVLHVKYVPNNKDFTVAANWTDAVFPTVTEAADLSLSLTADGSDIYMFYVLDAGTNSLVFRRCTGSGGGLGGICDNTSDWGSEKTLDNGTDNTHPQALVTKVTGDTIAIDTIYTTTTGPAVEYERHYVDLMDKTVTVAASGDDAYERNCISGTDDQDVAATTVKLGREAADASCVSSVDSENHIGLRFPSITVGQGAAISSAYVDLRVTTRTGTGAIDFTIYGEDADNSSAFTAFTDCSDPCANGVNTRTKTTSNTVQSVDFVTNTYRIDVTDLVQEIVCRGAANSQPCVGDFNGSGTWASGNALTLLLISAEGGAADNNILAVSQDDTGTTMLDPTLQINVGSSGKNYSLGSAVQLATGSASFTDFDHPLSTDEMSSVATTSAAVTTYWDEVLADNPTILFKMDEASGNLADSSGSGYSGVASGTLTYQQTGPTQGIPYSVLFGGGIFTITDSGSGLDLGDGPFSVEFWFKRSQLTASKYILGKTDVSLAAPGYAVEVRNGAPDSIRLQNGTSSTNTNTSGAVIDDTNWHHAVVTRGSAANGQIYLDGVSVAISTSALTFSDNNLSLIIGNLYSGYSAGWDGNLAAVAIYKSNLSATRVAAHYNNSILKNNYALAPATTVHASQSAVPAFMFKVNNSNNNNTDKIDASVVAKSTLSTSTKPVHLQVYRGGTTDNWVTMATNNNTAGDSEFTLTSPTISTNTSEYYFNETPGIGTRYAECTNSTANCWTYWRVYQEAPATSLNEVLSIDYVNITFTSNGPDKVAFSNSSRAFVVNACNGAANVFTMELQQGTTPTNPLSTTVVRVTSNASSYVIYSDASCSTPVTNGDFTYTTSQNSKDVYIIDSGSIGTHTLTGTRQSGDTLTTGTQNYTLNETPSTKLRGGTRIRGGTTIR